jgi:hypothetical protein
VRVSMLEADNKMHTCTELCMAFRASGETHNTHWASHWRHGVRRRGPFLQHLSSQLRCGECGRRGLRPESYGDRDVVCVCGNVCGMCSILMGESAWQTNSI